MRFTSVSLLALTLATTGPRLAHAETLGPVTDALGVVEVPKGQPIVIGGYSSQSGGDTNQGVDELRGATIAIKDADGKVLGFPVKLVGEDAQCTAEGGQTAATKLATDRQIVAVIGPSCSSGARVGAPILWNVGIPSVAFGASSPSLTAADRPNGFMGFLRVIPNDLKSAGFLADYAFDKLGLKEAATLHDGSPYTQQLVQAFEKDFTAKGGKIVTSEAVSPSDTDLRPVLTQIAARKPALLFTPTLTATVGFLLRQKAEIPEFANIKVIGGEGVFSANLIEAAGSAVTGFDIVGPSTNLFSQRFPAFVSEFKAEYGEAPIGGFSAYGYDAALLTMNAVKAVGKTDDAGNLYIGRKALHDAMMATKDLPGLTGALSCDEHGDCGASTYAIWDFVSDDPGSFSPGTNPKRIYP